MQMTDEQVSEEVRFIKQGEAWPLWPVLPVKHLDRGEPDHPEDENHGVMLFRRGPKIYLINLGYLKTGPLDPQLEGVRVLEYETFEDLVRAGWVAD